MDFSLIYEKTRFLDSDGRDNFYDARPYSAYSRHYLVRLDCPEWLLAFQLFYLELGHSRYKHSSIELYSDFAIEFFGDELMAKAQDKKNTRSDNFKGFLNVPLDDDEKASIKKSWDKFDAGSAMRALVDCGKLSVSYNEKNDTYNCNVTFVAGDLAGWCVSSFADTPQHALFVTWFKFERHFDHFPEFMTQRPLSEFG